MIMADKKLKIAVIGAGLVGKRHVHLVKENEGLELFAVVDPSQKAMQFSKNLGTQHFPSFEEFLTHHNGCDGVIVATPNHTHCEITTACIASKLPCLVEKPLAANSNDALAIVTACKEKGAPVLVGHHRRHHKVCHDLKAMIAGTELGRIVGAQLSWMLRKPEEYFAEGDWRTRPGGGPVWINMIHEIDLLRYFIGEIVEVACMLSNSVRNNAVEDTGVINMRFETGALASAIISDAAPSPWHFEGSSGENPNIAKTGKDGLRIFGTKASVSFPSMQVWSHEKETDHWGEPIYARTDPKRQDLDGEAALTAQLKNFTSVILGREAPLVTAEDGLQNVRIVEAIHESASKKQSILLKNPTFRRRI